MIEFDFEPLPDSSKSGRVGARPDDDLQDLGDGVAHETMAGLDAHGTADTFAEQFPTER